MWDSVGEQFPVPKTRTCRCELHFPPRLTLPLDPRLKPYTCGYALYRSGRVHMTGQTRIQARRALQIVWRARRSPSRQRQGVAGRLNQTVDGTPRPEVRRQRQGQLKLRLRFRAPHKPTVEVYVDQDCQLIRMSQGWPVDDLSLRRDSETIIF